MLLSAEGLARRFGYRSIFKNIGFSLNSGDALVLVGPNGAGKTTLLRVLAGLLRPSAGEVKRNVSVGLVSHNSMLYDALTAEENMRFAARLHGTVSNGRIETLLDRLGMLRWRDERVGTFSRGMTQRLAIARALLGSPKVLLLDEPLSGLDDPGTEVVREVIVEHMAGDGGLIVVTHQFERLSAVATHVGYLVGGGLQGPSTMDGLSADSVMQRYRSLLADG